MFLNWSVWRGMTTQSYCLRHSSFPWVKIMNSEAEVFSTELECLVSTSHMTLSTVRPTMKHNTTWCCVIIAGDILNMFYRAYLLVWKHRVLAEVHQTQWPWQWRQSWSGCWGEDCEKFLNCTHAWKDMPTLLWTQKSTNVKQNFPCLKT